MFEILTFEDYSGDMEFHLSRRKSHEYEIQSQILERAGTVVVEALGRREEGLPIQVDVPPAPRGIDDREYLRLLQNGVNLTLDLRNCEDIVCDEYHSSLVNARATTGRQKNLFTRHYYRQNPRLVFKELQGSEK
jgi:hypothetical protein